MRKIPSVIQLKRGRVGNQNVKPAVAEQTQMKFCHPLFHLPLRKLVRSLIITHRSAQPQTPDAVMDINLIVDTNTAVRRNLLIYLIMISMYI